MKNETTYLKLAVNLLLVLAAVVFSVGFSSFVYSLIYAPQHIAHPSLLLSYLILPALYYGAPNALLIFSVFLIFWLVVVFSHIFRLTSSTYGAARFASNRDIKRENLRAESGIICGFSGKPIRKYSQPTMKPRTDTAERLLIYGGEAHVIAYAPTRGGKGVGVVIPNLLTWPDSTIVLDIKRENWEKTAGFRKALGQDVCIFDPLNQDRKTIRYNPLAYVRKGTSNQQSDLMRVATFLMPLSSNNENGAFFDKAAKKLFVAIGNYICDLDDDRKKPLTIGQILREVTANQNIQDYLSNILELPKISEHTKRAVNDVLALHYNTFSSVRITMTTHLDIWNNPLIDAATSANDVWFGDFKKKPISLYVVVNPGDFTLVRSLLSVLFQQFAEINSRELPKDKELTTLLVLDEFTWLGKMPALYKGFSYFAGYNIKLLPIVQSPAQLKDVYGIDGAQNILSNCAVEIIFPPKDLKTAEELSKRCGQKTIEVTARSINPHKISHSSSNVSQQKRELLLPQEIMQLDRRQILLITTNMPPVLANRLCYYNEVELLERSEKYHPPEVKSFVPGDVYAPETKKQNTRQKYDEPPPSF